MRRAILLAGLLGLASGGASAGDLFADDVTTLLRTEQISVEALAGYVNATSTESVYDTQTRQKLSQLNWNMSSALALGGRVAVKPLDWLTFRVRGWGTVAADSQMHDYDWLGGYSGFDSYTHISAHPHTTVPEAWQGDASVAATFWQDESVAASVVGGYRHYQAKFEAHGGSYLYSVNAFRDTTGTFPAGQTVGTYQQTWDAAYAGLGLSYAAGPWVLTGEVYGGPVFAADATDNHLLRTLNIKSKLGTSTVAGVNGSVEYRFADHLSLVGRVEYQDFAEARGSARYSDTTTGNLYTNQRPGSGAAADTFLVSVGVKARM